MTDVSFSQDDDIQVLPSRAQYQDGPKAMIELVHGENQLDIRGELRDVNPLLGETEGDKLLYPFAGGLRLSLPAEYLGKTRPFSALRGDVKSGIAAHLMRMYRGNPRLYEMFPDVEPQKRGR